MLPYTFFWKFICKFEHKHKNARSSALLHDQKKSESNMGNHVKDLRHSAFFKKTLGKHKNMFILDSLHCFCTHLSIFMRSISKQAVIGVQILGIIYYIIAPDLKQIF